MKMQEMDRSVRAAKGGWKRISHALGLKLRGFVSNQFWDWKDPSLLDGPGVAALSDVDIYNTAVEDIQHLKSTGIKWWSMQQIEALTAEHIRHLTAHQLQALICNDNIAIDQVRSLLVALAPFEHVIKVGALVHAMEKDDRQSEKIAAFAQAINLDLSDLERIAVLTVLAKHASDVQFRRIVALVPFSLIKRLSHYELYNPKQIEMERLGLRVEDRRLASAYKIILLLRDLQKLDGAWAELFAEKTLVVEKRESPWKRADKRLVEKLQKLIAKDMDADARVGRVSEILESIKGDLSQKIIHCQMVSSRVSSMGEIWTDTQLERCRVQCDLLSHVVLPQYEILQEISQLLLRRLGKPMSQDEKAVLIQTLGQGRDLARAILPEALLAWRYLMYIRKDRDFIQESQDAFMDSIRYETSIGRFSMEFFRRMLVLAKHDEILRLLHSEDFEELIVYHPQFCKAIQFIQSVLDFQRSMTINHQILKEQARQFPIEEVIEQLEAALELLEEEKV